MTLIANARYRIHHYWSEESPFSPGMGKSASIFTQGLDERLETDLPQMARSRLLKTYTGDIEGDGEVVYLMMYGDANSARYVGLERIIGRLGGKRGSFVLQRTGVFEAGQANESYSVVPGSGTSDLLGLTGDGNGIFGHATEIPFELTYELP